MGSLASDTTSANVLVLSVTICSNVSVPTAVTALSSCAVTYICAAVDTTAAMASEEVAGCTSSPSTSSVASKSVSRSVASLAVVSDVPASVSHFAIESVLLPREQGSAVTFVRYARSPRQRCVQLLARRDHSAMARIVCIKTFQTLMLTGRIERK